MKLRNLLLVFAIAVAGLTAGCASLGGSQTKVYAEFTDTSGLFVGNDVGVLGVRIGKITDIKPEGNLVKVTMLIDGKRNIPADATALIVSRSVATNRYIELSPVYNGGAKLKSGDVLTLDRTRTPVEYDDLLKSLTKFGNAVIGPDPKNTSIKDGFNVLAANVKGNGQRIHDTISKLADSLNTIGGQTGNIKDTVNSLDSLTSVLATNDSTLRQFSETVTQATGMLADQHSQIQGALDSLNAALIELANFAQKHKDDLSGQVKSLTTIANDILEKRTQLEELLEVLPLATQNVSRAITPGHQLVVRVPPGVLSPNNVVLSTLCSKVPATLCKALDPTLLNLLGLTNLLGG